MASTLHNRQFIISNRILTPPSQDWYYIKLENFHLYYHPNLQYHYAQNESRRIILLGYAYSFIYPDFDNQEIVNKLIITKSHNAFLQETFNLSGTFVFIHIDANKIKITHDAGGLREVFYYVNKDTWFIGSQPLLLNKYIKSIKKTSINIKGVGPHCQYEGIFKLLPNYYLNVNLQIAKRYFPTQPLDELSEDQAIKQISIILKGLVKATINRKKVMFALTAGWDSRLLLAACKEHISQIQFFTIKTKNTVDLKIATKLAKKLNLNHTIIDYPKKINKEISEVCKQSISFCNGKELPILNLLRETYPNHLLVNGHYGEIGRNYFGSEGKINEKKLAALRGYRGKPYVIDYYNKWVKKNTNYGINLWDIFFWEEVVGNDLANEKSNDHLFLDILSLLNCHMLITFLLSVNHKKRDQYTNPFFVKLIKSLWPEALHEPINPDYKTSIIKVLKPLGVHRVLRWVKRNLS